VPIVFPHGCDRAASLYSPYITLSPPFFIRNSAVGGKAAERRTYRGISIEAVAREAHASKPTIYKWWGSKEKLIGEVYLNLTPLDPDATNLSSAQQELQKVWERLWKIWSNPKWATVSRQLFMASQDDPEALSRYRDGYLRERNKPLAAIIERGVARGELASNLDVELVVDLIAGFSLFRLLMEKPVDVATSQKILSILFGGLSKVPPAVKRNR